MMNFITKIIKLITKEGMQVFLIKRFKLLFLCLLVTVTGTLTACSSTPPPNTPELENTVRSYLAAIQKSEYQQAYNMSVVSFQYPLLVEARDQYINKIIERKTAQPIDNYTINRIAFYKNIAFASMHLTSKGKEYNAVLPLVKVNLGNKEHWLISYKYPIMQDTLPNSVIASASSDNWTAMVYLILSDEPETTGWAQMTVIQLGYTGNKSVTKYDCKKDIPGFTQGNIKGQRSQLEAQLTPQFTTNDISNGGKTIITLEQAEKLLREGSLNVTWEEGTTLKTEEILFNDYKTLLRNTSLPVKQ